MAATSPPGVKVLSIGELTRAIKQQLEEGYAAIWVRGRSIGSPAKPNSGHQYLTLKKDDVAPAEFGSLSRRRVAAQVRLD